MGHHSPGQPVSLSLLSDWLFLTGVSSGEIISNLQELQSLSVDPSAEKEKQKADVKHILQQKQRALSDLFKMLSQIGASASSSRDRL